MATTTTHTVGTIATLLSTELNSLANNALNISSSYSSSAGFLFAELELLVTYGTNPTANTAVVVWLLRAPDGTNFEDGGTSVTPIRGPDAVFPLRAVTTAQRIVRRVVIPPGTFQALLKNDGTGQTMAASGNTLKILPFTYLQS